jgi:hypothetical protein
MEAAVPVRARATAAVANYRADGGQSGGFVVLAASVAGTAHRLSGGRCEDAYGWVNPGPGRLGLIVADGVGTAGRGGEGADLAVEAACGYLAGCPGWGPDECREAVGRASDQLAAPAGAGAARPPSEFSTTLVVVLLTVPVPGTGAPGAVLARVGDSTAFVLDGGAWQELFPGRDDDLHHVVTDVLPLAVPGEAGRSAVETASVELAGGAAVVLVTDGVANPLRDGPATVAPALADLLRAGPAGELSPLALAAAVDFSRRGCHDDRTLVVAWARPAD